MTPSKPEHPAEIKGVADGARGCGFETWADGTHIEPVVQVLPYMGKPSEKPKKFHSWGAATAKATPAHISPERDDYESWS